MTMEIQDSWKGTLSCGYKQVRRHPKVGTTLVCQAENPIVVHLEVAMNLQAKFGRLGPGTEGMKKALSELLAQFFPLLSVEGRRVTSAQKHRFLVPCFSKKRAV